MSFADELRRQHVAILAVADELRAECASPNPAVLSEIFLIWGRFSQALQAHLLMEEERLYAPLLAEPNTRAANIARAFQNQPAELDFELTEFDKRWGPREVSGRWPEFCDDLLELLSNVRSRMTSEEEELYPLLERFRGDSSRANVKF